MVDVVEHTQAHCDRVDRGGRPQCDGVKACLEVGHGMEQERQTGKAFIGSGFRLVFYVTSVDFLGLSASQSRD